jgi:hypothetical protein
MSHWACQKVCWRKISTSRQAHNKPKKAGLTHVAESEACQLEVSIFRVGPGSGQAEKISVISGRKNPAHAHPTRRVGP